MDGAGARVAINRCDNNKSLSRFIAILSPALKRESGWTMREPGSPRHTSGSRMPNTARSPRRASAAAAPPPRSRPQQVGTCGGGGFGEAQTRGPALAGLSLRAAATHTAVSLGRRHSKRAIEEMCVRRAAILFRKADF